MTTIEQDRADFEKWLDDNFLFDTSKFMHENDAKIIRVNKLVWKAWQASAKLQREKAELAIPAIDVNKMVDRFLGWKLPDDFSPDCGISFKKEVSWPNHVYPIGTNLFNATQAKAMFEYCIHYQSDFNLEYTAKRIRRLLNVMDLPDPSNGNDNTLMGCLFSLLGQVCGKLESATPSAPIAQQSYADGLEATAKIVDEEFGL